MADTTIVAREAPWYTGGGGAIPTTPRPGLPGARKGTAENGKTWGSMGTLTSAAAIGLVGLCGFFAFIVARYGLLFYREARGARRLRTLAGAAAGIAIIVSILAGTFTQPLPALTPPPGRPAPAAAGGTALP